MDPVTGIREAPVKGFVRKIFSGNHICRGFAGVAGVMVLMAAAASPLTAQSPE